ncbi:MAG: sigma factor [Steroidobacteraceae bacterium]
MSSGATRRAIEAVWRIESARLIGALMRLVRDVGVAEDLAQESFIAALERWPTTGIPESPGAWLMTTAKNRAFDHLRQRKMRRRKHGQFEEDNAGLPPAVPDFEESVDDEAGDDLLRLIFIACHPVLSKEGRAALTLRLLGGL